MFKFKTKPRHVKAMRITDEKAGEIGSWFVVDGTAQTILSNDDFVKTYVPAGRVQEVKDLYADAVAAADTDG